MRILFFPFTHITQDQLTAVLSFFSSFDCLSVNQDFFEHKALNALYNEGRIHPVFPAQEQIKIIEQTSAQYLDWAKIHTGDKVNLKTLLSDTPYFTRDTDVTHIKSQLLKGAQTREIQTRETKNPQLSWQKELLFLKMAQLCDAQHDRIDTELKHLEKIQEDLVNSLRGLDTPISSPEDKKEMSNDLGDKMTGERIASWAGYMAREGHLNIPEQTLVFVTTSTAVFEYLESNCEDVVNPLDIKQIKVHENICTHQKGWQRQFEMVLMQAIQGKGCRKEDLPEVADDCSLSAQFKLGLFSGKMINQFFKMANEQVPVCLVKLK